MGLNDGAGYTPGAVPVDGGAAYGYKWTDDEGERKVSKKGVPSFPLYGLHVEKAELRYTKGGTPIGALAATVKFGPPDTAGRKVFFDMFLDVSPITYAEDGQTKIPKTEAEKEEGYARLNKIFNRVARIGKFALKRPHSTAKVHLEEYLSQFGSGGGFDCIADVKLDADYGRNSVWMESLAAFDDPADDKKLRAQGKTALEEAQIAVEKEVAKAQKQEAGRTAGSLKRSGLN